MVIGMQMCLHVLHSSDITMVGQFNKDEVWKPGALTVAKSAMK